MRSLLMSVLLAATAAPAIAQQPGERPDRTINVNASGTVQQAPERAVITVAVESSAPTAR